MTTITFEDGAYRLDGDTVEEEDLVRWRDARVIEWADELAGLAIDLLGIEEEELPKGATESWAKIAIEWQSSKVTRFVDRFRARVSEIVTTAYVTAAGGASRLSDKALEDLGRMIGKQEEYINGFADDLRAGKLSPAQAVARARKYAPAATEAFERGRAVLRGFDAPAMPGEFCEGRSNCRCWWEIVEEDGATVGYWRAVSDGETCQYCAGREEAWSPYRPPA